MISLSKKFASLAAPGAGREARQLTGGDAFCYPLYYFIPSITADGRYLIHHRAAAGEVQLFRLDLTTAESVQLTHANCPHTRWRPWCTDAGVGVLDHRSVLNVARGEVIYFNGPVVRAVDVATLADRVIFELPAGREAIGQNCVTPDGQWLIYIHADAQLFADLFAAGDNYGSYYPRRGSCVGTRLCAYNFDSGEHRSLVNISSPIHHVLPYDNERVVFCHPASENGMLLTDLRGGRYTHLRTADDDGAAVCHYVATARGLAYEVLPGRRGGGGVLAGMYDPLTDARYELPLPDAFGYTHTGRDPAGELWFYENRYDDAHDLHALVRHDPAGEDRWLALTGDWPTYGGGQKSHFHPQLTPDRQWILMTAGDPATQTNHIFLLDAADLTATQGIPRIRIRSATRPG